MAKIQLIDIEGIGDSTAIKLVHHGFTTVRKLVEATPEDISAVPGFQITRAVTIQQVAKELLKQETDAPGKKGKDKDTLKQDGKKKSKKKDKQRKKGKKNKAKKKKDKQKK